MSDQTAPRGLIHHFERTISPAPVDARLVADLLEWDRVGEHLVVILPGGGP